MHQLQEIEKTGLGVMGHIKILDPESGEVFVNKRNAINYENMSVAIAHLLSNLTDGDGTTGNAYHVLNMGFGNGGVNVDATGVVTYQATNTNSATGQLYNETYSKGVANTASADPDNNMVVLHTGGNTYSDIVITSTLGYNEPSGQDALDNAANLTGNYIFDELGLKTPGGVFLTHVIFHPVQKSANRKIQIIYTIRITAGS